jgi:hypothetical protein
MSKALAFFFITLLGLVTFRGLPLLAQEAGEPDYDNGEPPIESGWDGYMPDLYSRGDQTFTISAGVIFPILFLNQGTVMDHHFKPPIGGSLGPLAYTYFLNSHFFVGGEIGFMFNYTLAEGTIVLIPIGVHAGYQPRFRRFEFPLGITVGIAPQKYLNFGYFGFFMKGMASVFYRFNPDWSFGLNVNWNWFPQWPMEDGDPAPNKNMDGNIIGLTFSARYHF